MNKLTIGVLALALGVASAEWIHERSFADATCSQVRSGSFSMTGCYNEGEESHMLECDGTVAMRISYSMADCQGEVLHEETHEATCEMDGPTSTQRTCVAELPPLDVNVFATMRTWQHDDCDKGTTTPSQRRVYYAAKDVCLPEGGNGFMKVTCDSTDVLAAVRRYSDSDCTLLEEEEFNPTDTCIWNPNESRSEVLSCKADTSGLFDGPTGEPRPIPIDDDCDGIIPGIMFHPEFGYVAEYCHPNWMNCNMVQIDASRTMYQVPSEVTRSMHVRTDCVPH
jgi:hypothetical protein